MSVSIFLAILLIALTWLYIKFSNETVPKENKVQTENEISKDENALEKRNIPYAKACKQQLFSNSIDKISFLTSAENDISNPYLLMSR